MLLKAVEDFKKYTLRALPTLVDKLAYISSLQGEDGSYTHWGLSRSFGDQRAQRAIRTAHSTLALEVLRQPIRSHYQDLQQAQQSQSAELGGRAFKLNAPTRDDELLSAHLRLIQESLVAVGAQASASQPAA